MTLYFDTRVRNPEATSISTEASWHGKFPLLAVAAYSQDKGGFVTIYDDQGEVLPDVESPRDPVARVTALAWHPARKCLAAGWENGELKVWPGDAGKAKFETVVSPHRTSLTILRWSRHGSRLVSADAAGFLLGWKIDSRGELLMLFHHELASDPLTHIAFKVAPSKASAAAEERPVDLMNSWRPRTAGRGGAAAAPPARDNYSFYIGSSSGTVYFVDSQGQCSQVLKTEGGAATLYGILHHRSRDSLVIMTEGLTLGHYQADPTSGHLTELNKVKLNVKCESARTAATMCWTSGSTLAILTGDLSLRCWDLSTADSYVLSPPDTSIGSVAAPQESATSLAFCAENGTLAVGTNLGTIYLWKRERVTNASEGGGWSAVPESCTIHGTVKQLTWSSGGGDGDGDGDGDDDSLGTSSLGTPLLAVNCITSVFILHQQAMCAAYKDGVSACQLTPSQILLEIEDGTSWVLKAEIQVRMMAVDRSYVALSSARRIVTYQLLRNDSSSTLPPPPPPATPLIGSFACDAEKLLIHEDTLIVMTRTAVQLASMQGGSVLQVLPSLPEEGEPIGMELAGRYLTVASLHGTIKLWEVGKREAKLASKAMPFNEAVDDFAEIIEAKCNADCRYVSVSVATSRLLPSSVIYVWDIESDRVYQLDLAESTASADEQSPLYAKGGGVGHRGRLVTAHHWDTDDPRLLVCRVQTFDRGEARIIPSLKEQAKDVRPSVALVSLFVSPDRGIVVRESRPLHDENCRLLAVCSPHIVILDSEKTRTRASGKLVKLLMSDFEELEDCDSTTKKAILEFSYCISIASMDEAFRAIKSMKNERVWKSLARMCVKTKQLDMALLCLGHMKRARAARALREAMRNGELNVEAKVGVLAVELGLYGEAARLFREAKRLDLLGRLLEARNKFAEAIELAANEDKIREKTSCYNYAVALEQEDKRTEAMEMFSRADCHRFEVPRMLRERPQELAQYLANSEDPRIVKWHGQYVESTGDIEAALRLYEQAKDTLSMTRLLCHLGREEEVCELVAKTSHAASAYHLAARFEAKNDVARAVHFYTVAKAYANAIRLCKENNMTEELWPLAMLAPRELQIDVGKYYEECDQADRAVMLYRKAGLPRRALEVAFRTRQYGALQLVVTDISADPDPDPALVEKCADYFVRNEEIEKAVDLLATGKRYAAALELISEHNVPLTEELSERLTPERGTAGRGTPEKQRTSLLERIGEIAFDQANYHLATKKFTQAGDKIRAMKALLKSGDTEKICFFAQVSRQREIYVMAANYLQSLDWQNQPEVLRNIINFYSKGKATDLLANFYVTCAQVEIDEFQNYEKALDALSQASRCLGKVVAPVEPEVHKRAVESVNERMSTVRRYVEMQRLFARGETDAALAQVRQLLEQGAQLERSIRRGDLFASVTRHYLDIGDSERARATVEELRRTVPGINLDYFYDVETLRVLGYVATTVRRRSSSCSKDDHDHDDDIEERIDA